MNAAAHAAQGGDAPLQHFAEKWLAREPEMRFAESFFSAGERPRMRAWGALLHELRREWRGLTMLGGSLGPLAIAWWLRNRAVGGTSAYASEFWWVHPYNPSLGTIGPVELLVRIYENVIRYGTERLPSLFFWEGAELTVVAVAAVVVLIVLAIVGWAGRLRRPGVAELFLPLYIGLLLVWPATWSGERFLLPILPLLLGYAALALLKITERVRMPVLLPAGAAALLAAGMVYGQYGLVQLASECRRGYAAGSPAPCLAETWTDLLSIGPLLRGRLPPGSVVIHRKPSLFFVASGYRSRLYPKSPDPQVFFQMVRESGADYVVVDQIADMAPYIHSVVTSANRYFCIVPELSFDNAVLMRIVPDAPPMPARAEGNDFRKCGVEQ